MPAAAPCALALAALAALAAPGRAQDDALDRAIAAHARSPMVDGHNDMPYAIRNNFDAAVSEFDFVNGVPRIQTSLNALRAGGVGAQYFVSYTPCSTLDVDSVRINLELIDLLHRLVEQYPNDVAFAQTADELEAGFSAGKTVILLSIEGGHALDNSLGALRMFARLGVSALTLTHNCDLLWCDYHAGSFPNGGLSDFGRKVVLEANRLGVAVDMAHISPDSMRDVIATSIAPVYSSHSNAYTLCNSSRNLPDDVLQGVKDKGGLVMVVALNTFVCDVNGDGSITVEDLADHVDYLAAAIGVEHIGYGSDFDGGAGIPGLTGPEDFHNLTAELFRRGYSDSDVEAIIGGNFLRFKREVEKTAAELQASTMPQEDTMYPNLECRSGRFGFDAGFGPEEVM